MADEKEIEFKSLNKAQRRKTRNKFIKDYGRQMHAIGLTPGRRTQLRVLFDRAVAENKLRVEKNAAS